MAKSVSEHMHNEYILLKKVENKKKSVEFFKSNQIRKTLQSHGWQSMKCKKCYNDEPHIMKYTIKKPRATGRGKKNSSALNL